MESRYSFLAPKSAKTNDFSKFDYNSGAHRRRTDYTKNMELSEFSPVSENKDKFYETIEKLNIRNKAKYWLEHTKEWMHEGVLKRIYKLDLENLMETCRLLSRYRYNLVFVQEDDVNQRKQSAVPYDYEKICKYYFNPSHRTIDMEDLLSMELKQTLVGQLYGKYYYSIKGKPAFEPSQKEIATLEKYLSQRRDIEKYYSIDKFEGDTRFYVFDRIVKLVESPTLSIKYNSGGSFNGVEWSTKYPTDSQIIMSMFCTCLERKYRDGSELKGVIRIFYDYMDYHSKYGQNKESLYIVQTAPPNYAPSYKVLAGNEELSCLPGNNNVFYAILFFLFEIKTKKNGVFGENIKPLLDDIFRYT